MTTIYTKVVADLFHAGHVNFFRQARELGDRLVVQVVGDARVAAAKRAPLMTQAERLAVVAGCRWVDEAQLDGPRIITRAFMDKNNYAIYAYAAVDEAEAISKRRDCADLPDDRVRVLRYTADISSTLIYQRLRERLGMAE
jgi:cytidyltransferase-like protein